MKVFEIYIDDYRVAVIGKSEEELDKDLQEFIEKEKKELLPKATIYNFDDYTIINFPENDAKRIYEVLKRINAKPIIVERTGEHDGIVIPKQDMDFIELDDICNKLTNKFNEKYLFGVFQSQTM